MEMLLMGLCVSMLGVAVTAIAFRAATCSKSSDADVQPEARPVKAAAPACSIPQRIAAPSNVPLRHIPNDALLWEIENHIRLEQVVAESFMEFPTHALLYSKTTSPFVN